MKKMYLTSAGLGKLPSILSKSPSEAKVAFIPTAADPYDDKWFIDVDLKKLNMMGFSLTQIDIKGKDQNELQDVLKDFDVIYVAGGNAFYLLEKIYQSGFDKVVKELLNKGVVYAGASAGAVIVCPTIEPMAELDDPSKAPNLKSYQALNLIDFVILPHYGKEKYIEKYKKIMDTYQNKGYEIITLTDQQAIIVEGSDYRIVETDQTAKAG